MLFATLPSMNRSIKRVTAKSSRRILQKSFMSLGSYPHAPFFVVKETLKSSNLFLRIYFRDS